MLEHFSWVHGLWLFGAIALEILANVLLKMSNGFKRWGIGAAAIACVLGAFTCLSFAVKGIPLSVATLCGAALASSSPSSWAWCCFSNASTAKAG